MSATSLFQSEPHEAEFDNLTKLAAAMTRSEVAVLNLVGADTTRFKSCSIEQLAGYSGTRDNAICSYTICEPTGILTVDDLAADPRFEFNLVTQKLGMRFYAGVVITDSAGLALGTLCVAQKRPNPPNKAEIIKSLEVLARQASALVELKYRAQTAEAALQDDTLLTRVIRMLFPSYSSATPTREGEDGSDDGGSSVEVVSLKSQAQPTLKTKFQELLETSEGRQKFAEFLSKEFSAENLLFWQEAELYRQHPSADHAAYIYRTFVVEGAPLEVNTPQTTKALIKERLDAGPKPQADVFAEVQMEVFGLMENDSFKRFSESPEYEDFQARTQRLSGRRYSEAFLQTIQTGFNWFSETLKAIE